MCRLTEKEINDAIKMKSNALIRKIVMDKKNADLDLRDVLNIFYNSKTFACLQKKETLFYLKPVAELLYLLDKEYQGDWKAWEWQAF